MALVNLSARLIEKYLFLRHFQNGVVFRFHARPEFVNLQHDGAIALAPDATIMAADETAMQLLHAENRSALIGRPIDAVFDVNAAELIEPGRRASGYFGGELRPVRDVALGRRFFASLDRGAMHTQVSIRPAKSARVMQVEAPAASARVADARRARRRRSADAAQCAQRASDREVACTGHDRRADRRRQGSVRARAACRERSRGTALRRAQLRGDSGVTHRE